MSLLLVFSIYLFCLTFLFHCLFSVLHFFSHCYCYFLIFSYLFLYCFFFLLSYSVWPISSVLYTQVYHHLIFLFRWVFPICGFSNNFPPSGSKKVCKNHAFVLSHLDFIRLSDCLRVHHVFQYSPFTLWLPWNRLTVF